MKTKNVLVTGLVLLFCAACLPVQAQNMQETLPYRPKSEFGQDTLLYLEYNFTKRYAAYKGKTIADVVKDLEYPVLYLKITKMIDRTDHTDILSFSLVIHQVRSNPSPLRDYFIDIDFKEPIISYEFREGIGFKTGTKTILTPKAYDYLKDIVIEGIGVNPYAREFKEKDSKK